MESLKNKAGNLLRSSERVLKLDIVYLTKGSFWMSLRFFISTVTSIATMVAFGNLLSRESYGTYNYLLSLGASLSFLTLSGTSTGVMRAVARGYENVVPAALRLQLRYNLIAVGIVLSAALYYLYKGNSLFFWSLLLLAFAYPIAEAFHIFESVLTGNKRFDTLVKVTSVITIISAAATITTIYFTSNVLAIISVYSAVSLLPNIVVYKMVTKNLDKSEPDEIQINEMRRTSFHLTGAGVIGVIASYIDRLLLFQIAGPASLAVYGFASAGPDRLKSFTKNWFGIALPGIAQRSMSEIRHILYRRLGFSLIIGFCIATSYAVLAKPLFQLFLPNYMDAVIYSQIQALSLIFVPATVYLGGIFAGQNMLRATYLSSTGNQVIRIALFVILGWMWQIWGLVIALILSSLISMVYSIIVWESESRRLIAKNEQQ